MPSALRHPARRRLATLAVAASLAIALALLPATVASAKSPRWPEHRTADRVHHPIASSSTTTTAHPPLTSCQSVVHIGDSTSVSLISPAYLSPPQQLPAQYTRVGVAHVVLEISGARSIVETYEGRPNAYTVARQLVGQGYHGCWVLALGTNDAANVAVGSPVSMAQRIDKMMSVIGDQPVMWVAVKSLVTSGPYAESNMAQWDQTLLQACPHYPTMRVFDWPALAQPGWYISDGIHYNSTGSAILAAQDADALARAFPAHASRHPTPARAKHATPHHSAHSVAHRHRHPTKRSGRHQHPRARAKAARQSSSPPSCLVQ